MESRNETEAGIIRQITDTIIAARDAEQLKLRADVTQLRMQYHQLLDSGASLGFDRIALASEAARLSTNGKG